MTGEFEVSEQESYTETLSTSMSMVIVPDMPSATPMSMVKQRLQSENDFSCVSQSQEDSPRFWKGSGIITPNKKTDSQVQNMTPSTRKGKSRIAEDFVKLIFEFELPQDDLVDVLTLSLKKLNVLDQVSFTHKPTKSGRKLTPFSFRKKMWDFWHENSQESTNTRDISKMRVTEKPQIQNELN